MAPKLALLPATVSIAAVTAASVCPASAAVKTLIFSPAAIVPDVAAVSPVMLSTTAGVDASALAVNELFDSDNVSVSIEAIAKEIDWPLSVPT